MSPVVVLCSALAVLAGVGCSRILPGPDSCPPGSRYCERGKNARCVRLEYWCDGSWDCTDGTDEKNCTLQCSPLGFHCDGRCIRSVFRCDGQQDCTDWTDESGCGDIPAEQLFKCGGGVTRRSTVVCDGHLDCIGDEAGCRPEKCQGGAVVCNGDCWVASHRCDGWEFCRDGRDEADCPDNFTSITSTTSTTTTASTPTPTTAAITSPLATASSTATTTTATSATTAGTTSTTSTSTDSAGTTASTATPTSTNLTPISPTTTIAPRDLTALEYILSGTSLLFGALFALACVLWRRATASRASHSEEPEYAMVEYRATRCTPAGTPGAAGAPEVPARPGVPPGTPGVPGAALEQLQASSAVDNPTYFTSAAPSSNCDLTTAYDRPKLNLSRKKDHLDVWKFSY